MTIGESALVQAPLSEETDRRFRNRDLPDRSLVELTAERHLLIDQLARAVYGRRQPSVIWTDGYELHTDIGWLRRRLTALDAEVARRRQQ